MTALFVPETGYAEFPGSPVCSRSALTIRIEEILAEA